MFSIVHLSDLHYRDGSNWLENKASIISRVMLPYLEQATHVVVIVSGDIAFSGKVEEYALAEQFLAAVAAELQHAYPKATIKFIVTPGNHDCNFGLHDELREVVVNALVRDDKAHEAGTKVVEQCASIQEPFWTFESRLSGRARPAVERCGFLETLELEGARVEVVGMNSAWLSRKREEAGAIAVPAASLAIPQSIPDFRIGVIHHPANWHSPGAGRDFRDFLLNGVDLLLVGHEHDEDIHEVGRPNGGGVVVQDAPALQSDGASGFSLLTVDLQGRVLDRRVFTWKGSSGAYEVSEPERILLDRVGRAAHSKARPRQVFLSLLSDPGATFTHPRSDTVRLEDIFVWPDIDVRSFKKLDEAPSMSFRGADARVRLRTTKKLLIEGTERSGRTALAKMVASDLLAEGKTVVLLDGGKIEASDADTFLAACRRSYKAQYEGNGLEALLQTEPHDVALVIDDFDACTLGVGHLVKILQVASRSFGHVVVFVSDLFRIQELFAHPGLQDILDFDHVLMTEFGYRAVRELIERWYKLGVDLLAEGRDYEDEVAEAEQYVNAHIGRGIFPSYPLCVLTLLQAREAGTTTDLSAGAYGAIFEALLQTALQRHSRGLPTEFLQTFLAEAGLTMLRSGQREMRNQEFRELISAFMEATLNRFQVEEVVRALVEARLIVLRDDTVRFRYAHIYYLSTAKGIQLHKQDPARRAQVAEDLDRLFASLHTDSSSNIVMFYLHFSRDLEAVERLVASAEEVFSEYPLADPTTVDLGTSLPWPRDILEGIGSDQQEGIQRYRMARDEAERVRGQIRSEDERVVAQLSKYHKCVKLLQVIGQVVRSFPGMLPRELKLRSSRGVVRLALRALSEYAARVREGRTAFRAALVEYLATTRRVANSRDAVDHADRAIFYWALAAAHGLIRRAADALCSSHIIPTMEVLKSDGMGSGFDMVEMAVRLDLGRGRADLKDAVDVKKKVSSSPLASFVVEQLVTDFLQTFRLPTSLRSRFITAFGLEAQKKLLPAPGERILEAGKKS